MKHPAETELALLAGGDVNIFRRLALNRHVHSCGGCRDLLASFRRSREEFRRECDTLPEGIHWDRLAAEMTANIHLGLAAGECVAEATRRTRGFGWRPALATGGVALLLFSGWWLNLSPEAKRSPGRGIRASFIAPNRPAAEAGISLEANRAGIQVRENGSTLTLMNPGGATASVVSVSTQGALRARYIDADTGQVTITNVYAQ